MAAHDYDNAGVSDGDIDLDDFTGLTGCFAGPYVTPGQDCARPSRGRSLPESGTYALHGRPVDVLSDGLVLVNYRARTYLPQHARFLQRDPTGYPDGHNLYEAFASNPLTFLDPFGTEVIADVAVLKFDELVARGWIDIYDTLAARGVDVYCRNYGCTHELCREVETLTNALKVSWGGGEPDFVALGERSVRAGYQLQGKAGEELEALVSEVSERELYTLGGTLYHRMLHQFVRTDSRRIKRTQEELTKELLNFTLGMTMTPGMSIYGKARRAGSFLDDALSLSDDALGVAGRSPAKAGQTAKKISAAKGGDPLRRPYKRKAFREQVENAAPRTPDGRPIDPNLKTPIEGKPHFGHVYGKEHRRLLKEAEAMGMDQRQFNDWINSHPEWFQLQDPISNMRHFFEKAGG